MENENSGKKRRSLRGYLVRPRQQLLLTLAMLSTLIVFLAVIVSLFSSSVERQIAEQRVSNPQLAAYLQGSIVPDLRLLHGGILLLIVMGVLMAIVLSHKVYGPTVPILRHIRALQSRDFSSRIHLRKGDEFEDVARALNELAESLAKQQN